MTDQTSKSQRNDDLNIDLIVQNNANLRPPDEIKIEKINASPYPDNRRVKVSITVTPFRERPNLEITILDANGRPVANTSAIGLMNFATSYVLHLRGVQDPAGTYTIRVQLFYESLDEIQDTCEADMRIPPATSDED